MPSDEDVDTVRQLPPPMRGTGGTNPRSGLRRHYIPESVASTVPESAGKRVALMLARKAMSPQSAVEVFHGTKVSSQFSTLPL